MAKPTGKRRRSDDDEDDEDSEQSADEKDLESSRMPFLSHLAELRDRVRNAALWFLLSFVVCWYFAQQIFTWLKEPMYRAWAEQGLQKRYGDPHVVFTKLVEPFWIEISIGMWAGIFLSSPFIFHQLWKFIAPGLYKRERRITVLFALFSGIFFCCGALFCYYFVLDNLYNFLLGYANVDDNSVQPMIVMSEYLDLTRDMMLAFGAVFELPLLILFLSMVGLVTHRGLWKFNRWFVVIAFIVGAILTPSPDVVSQVMMAVPMVVLYNLSIVIAWIVTRKREKAEAELKAKEEAADAKERARRKAKKRDEDEDEDNDDEDDD